MPRICAACGVKIDLDSVEMCQTCMMDVVEAVGLERCGTCGDDKGPHLLVGRQCTGCRTRGPVFERFVCVGAYRGALRRLVLRFKHEFVLDHLLGGLLAQAIAGAVDRTEIDYWIPIPSHWLRRVRRGFQPTALLTRSALRDRLGAVAPLLEMTRYVPPFHHGMTSPERARAIKGAFRIPKGGAVHGRCVIVIDDVSRTGATLREAATVLRQAGATRVIAAVVGKTSSSFGRG